MVDHLEETERLDRELNDRELNVVKRARFNQRIRSPSAVSPTPFSPLIAVNGSGELGELSRSVSFRSKIAIL